MLGGNEYLWTIADEKIQDIRSREINGLVVAAQAGGPASARATAS